MNSENYQNKLLEKIKSENNYVKTSTIIIIFQFIMILSLIITILLLFPLKKKEPYFIQFSNNEENYVFVRKANEELRTNENLANQALNYYVINREKINFIDDDRRKAYIKAYSNKDNFRLWIERYNIIKEANKRQNYYRNIKIISTSRIKNDVVIIEINVKDYENGKLTFKNSYKVTIQYGYSNLKMSFKEANLNPLGMIIQRYNIEEIDTEREERIRNFKRNEVGK